MRKPRTRQVPCASCHHDRTTGNRTNRHFYLTAGTFSWHCMKGGEAGPGSPTRSAWSSTALARNVNKVGLGSPQLRGQRPEGIRVDDRVSLTRRETLRAYQRHPPVVMCGRRQGLERRRELRHRSLRFLLHRGNRRRVSRHRRSQVRPKSRWRSDGAPPGNDRPDRGAACGAPPV